LLKSGIGYSLISRAAIQLSFGDGFASGHDFSHAENANINTGLLAAVFEAQKKPALIPEDPQLNSSSSPCPPCLRGENVFPSHFGNFGYRSFFAFNFFPHALLLLRYS
jgi:hypothetical protein